MPRPSSLIGDRTIGVNGDVDGVAVAGHGLVDRVVDHLVDEVVQTAQGRVADVHAGPFADGLDAFEHPDVGFGVGRGAGDNCP